MRLLRAHGTGDSGKLAGDHNPTSASAPDKIFDISLHECICKPCNGRFSYTASPETKIASRKIK